MDSSFGAHLKDWRSRRRLSQLDLGLAANVSSRHISFLETGRSLPSQSMVLQLCDYLEVPRAARNTLLNAAGFAHAYRRRDLDDKDMEPVRAAMAWTLERHDPYPAMALDRHWMLVDLNRTATMLLSGAGLAKGDSLLDVMADIERLKTVLENWEEVAKHMLVRLQTESQHLGGDDILDQAIAKLDKAVGDRLSSSLGTLPAVIPARYQSGDVVLSLFSTLAQFGTAEDIALAELKIELLFPADDPTRDFLNALTMENAS